MAQDTIHRSRYPHRRFKALDSIRLTLLLPGAFEDDVRIELKEVSLSKPPPYLALSYVWGSPTGETPISCHGEELLVTANCVAAIRRIRDKKLTLAVWIDAICIDQGQMEERSRQVELMGDIYSKATGVVIWLGEATPFTNFAISFLSDLVQIERNKWLRPLRRRLLDKKLRTLQDRERRARQDGLPNSDVLESICDHAWFTRKWTIQEYVLSQDSWFQCGDKVIDTAIFFAAMRDFCRRYGLENSHDVAVTAHLASYLYCFETIKLSIDSNIGAEACSALRIFADGRAQTATNPKDAVFAMYGMLQKLHIKVAPPNYSQSVEKIYTETAKTIILHDRSVKILQHTYESHDWPDLPSWVPDWNSVEDMYGVARFDFTASRSSAGKFSFLNGDRSISVRGRFIGEITRRAERYPVGDKYVEEFPELRPRPKSEVSWQDIIHMEAYREWINLAYSLTTYPYGETLEQSFCYTLVPQSLRVLPLKEHLLDNFATWLMSYSPGNTVPSKTQPDSLNTTMELVDLNKFSRCREQNRSHAMDFAPQKERLEYDVILRRLTSNSGAMDLDIKFSLSCLNTRFFITSGGRMGRSSRNIQKGDLMALIAGVDVPMIIRKEGDLYRIKGPAYVHGIMNGEEWPEKESDLIDIVLS